MEERKSKILGPTGEYFLNTRPVGGRIPRKDYPEWENFKSKCAVAGIKVNPEGLIDMIKSYNKMNKVLYPIASLYDFNPVEFRNDVLDIVLSKFEEIIDKKEWKKDSVKVKQQMRTELHDIAKTIIA